nr:hypothetical protein [Tanacetum cinerariifolium]
TKTTQANKIDSLKRRVKKLETKQRSRTLKLKRHYKVDLTAKVESSDDNEDLGEDASKHGRISDIDADECNTLVSTHDDAEMFHEDKDLHGEDVFVAQQDENVVEKEVDAAQVQVTKATTTPTISIDEVTLAQALAKLKHTKPKAKAKRIVFHELEESTTTTTATISKSKSQDKEVALKLQAELQTEFDKEKRLAGKRAQQEEEANIALIETWEDVQAKIDADYLLAERLNGPPTRAQQRSIMCNYLKNMEGWKLNSLKNKSFANIQELFDKAMKRVNTFVNYKTELVEESSKKAEAEVMKESSKRA